MSSQNPYSPPTTTSEDLLPKSPAEFGLTRLQLFKASALCTVISIISVMFYQLTIGSSGNSSASFRMLESISFGIPAVAVIVSVGYFGSPRKNGRTLGIATVCSLVACGCFGCVHALLNQMPGRGGLFIAVSFLFGSMITMLWIILFMHGAKSDLQWVLLASVVGSATWVGLTFLIISMLVKGMSNPFDDYVGYTSLTIFWVWAVMLQIPIATKVRSA